MGEVFFVVSNRIKINWWPEKKKSVPYGMIGLARRSDKIKYKTLCDCGLCDMVGWRVLLER